MKNLLCWGCYIMFCSYEITFPPQWWTSTFMLCEAKCDLNFETFSQYQSNMCLTIPSEWVSHRLRLLLALCNMCEKKKPYIYVILLVPWQPLLTQYPVSERVSLQHVAFGPSPNRRSMKITHPVMACSSLKAISVPSDEPPHGSEARSDWQDTTLPASTSDRKPLTSLRREGQGRFELFVGPRNSTAARPGDQSYAESPDKQHRLPLRLVISFFIHSLAGALPPPRSTCHIPPECQTRNSLTVSLGVLSFFFFVRPPLLACTFSIVVASKCVNDHLCCVKTHCRSSVRLSREPSVA